MHENANINRVKSEHTIDERNLLKIPISIALSHVLMHPRTTYHLIYCQFASLLMGNAVQLSLKWLYPLITECNWKMRNHFYELVVYALQFIKSASRSASLPSNKPACWKSNLSNCFIFLHCNLHLAPDSCAAKWVTFMDRLAAALNHISPA